MNIFEYFFQNSQDLCCIANLEGYFEIINPNFEKKLGYSQKEMLENKFFNFIHPDDIGATQKELEKLKTGAAIINFVNRFRKKDSTYLWFEWSATPDYSNDKLYAIARDITERKLSVLALQESEEKYRDLFDNAFDIIQFVDPQGKILYVNNAWKKILGYSDEEIKTKIIFDIIHPDYLQQCKDIFARLLKGEEMDDFEMGFLTRGNQKIIVNGSSRPTMKDGKMISTRGIFREITQKKLDEENLKKYVQDLRNSEQKIKAIFDNAPDPVIVIDDNGSINKWNPKSEIVFGWKSAEVLGKPLIDYIIPNRLHESYKREMELISTTNPIRLSNRHFEIEAKNQKGIEFPISFSISSYKIDEKKYYFICFLRDITENKKVLEALKISENFLNSIIENIPTNIFVKDVNDLKYVRINKQVEELFGYSKEKIIGKNDYELFPKEEADRFTANDKELLRTKTLFEIEEEPAHTKNKGIRILQTKIVLINDSTGKPIYILGISNDITDRKNADELLRLIVESSPSALILVNNKGEMILVNAQTEKLFGYNRKELLDQKIEMLIPERFRKNHGAFCSDFSAAGKARGMGAHSEIYGLRKNDTEMMLEIGLSPISTSQGKQVLATIFDITDRKKTTEELKQKSEELARSNTELEQFAYVASHDLQVPLRMVTSYLQLLEKRNSDKLDQEAKDFISFAVDGSERMRALIHSLLDYSRINRFKPFEEISINELLKVVLENLSTSIKENKAIIKISALPIIFGDPVLINQLFQNLIGNAIKFRNSKDPEIEISYREENGYYLFSVKDNGIGIEKENIDKIFVIFKRLHNKEKYPGTGMGLAICKKIVERHGGKIWVESDIGKGSTFYFTIKKQQPEIQEKG